MPVDPNHEPLKRAVYLTDDEWRLLVLAIQHGIFYSQTPEQALAMQVGLAKIEYQLKRSS